MTDEDDSYWQAMQEQEREEQEAADALESYQSLYRSPQGIASAPDKEFENGIRESGTQASQTALGSDRP